MDNDRDPDFELAAFLKECLRPDLLTPRTFTAVFREFRRLLAESENRKQEKTDGH